MVRRSNLVKPIPKEELRAAAAALEKKLLLWNSPEFQQQFVEPVEKDLKRIEDSQWALGNSELTTLLQELGIGAPSNAESLLTLFMCARSVVAFWEKRLRPFREAERNLNELRKRIEEK